MAFLSSKAPGVQVREIDLTGSVQAIGTSAAAIVGDFTWGPVDVRTQISNSGELVSTFGKPTDRNYVGWLSASNFLSYSGMLYVVRVVDNDALNATADAGLLIKNEAAFNALNDGATHIGKRFAARYPGALGNSLAISIADIQSYDKWQYANEFDAAPGTSEYAQSVGAKYDEVHIVVIDKLGEFTGTPGAILERYAFLSKASDAKQLDGAPAFFGQVINQQSQYVWYFGAPDTDAYDDTYDTNSATTEWGKKLVIAGQPQKFKVLRANATDNHNACFFELKNGADGAQPDQNELVEGWSLFQSVEEIDVGILITGDGGGETSHTRVVQYIIDNICEKRKDCVVVYSPKKSDVTNKTQSQAVTAILATRNAIGRSSSYAVMDSGWKLMYDVYNDKNRWVPLNSDVAGLMAATENDYDAWWSPAGFNRGKIKNVISLAFNPNSDSRDNLYKQQVNSVVTFVGDGTILYGDKTQQAKASAFQFINVRRLFITLKKSIGKSSRYVLFEFNDEFTQGQFKALVDPFLREVKGRRGITDYRVVCDKSNNTDDVVDRGEFVAAIYVKAARSINWVRLDLVNTRNGMSFSEAVGYGG